MPTRTTKAIHDNVRAQAAHSLASDGWDAVAELARPEQPRRSLPREQRRELLRLIDAVPDDATVKHPAVVALLEYRRSLRVPSWAPPLDYRIRLGDIAAGVASLRRLAECEDWGDDPALPCDCGGCRRRARLGVYHTIEEYQRLGLFCERRAR
jgi:hypothetical protein